MGLFGKLFEGRNNQAVNQRSAQPQRVDVRPQLERLGREAVSRYMNKVAAGLVQKDEDIDSIFHKYETLSDAQLEAYARDNDKYAVYVLGERLADREHLQEAYPWFEKAANLGMADGYYMLAGYATNGWAGKQIDKGLALQYLRKAAELGMLYGAAEQIAEILVEMDTRQSTDEACKWYTILAEGAKEFGREDASYFQKMASASHSAIVSFELYGGKADQDLEDRAMIAWYYDNEARKDRSQNWPKDDLGMIHFNLGRCGVYRNRDWAKPVLEMGVGYNSPDCRNLLNSLNR